MRLPPVQPRSRLAHEAAQWARTLGRFDEYHAAVFRAFFERGEDIGQSAVLVNLARDLGLDYSGLADALELHTFQSSVLQDEQDAQRFGVPAVPAFIANRKAALTGAVPGTSLQDLVGRVRSLPM